MEADGTITHLGRADEVMNAGGYRVAPQEVEAALLRHPGIAEAAAVDLPVREGVSIVAAFFVPAGDAPEADELARHCEGLLARYKCPREFHAVASLPRGSNGKLIRRKLRDMRGGV